MLEVTGARVELGDTVAVDGVDLHVPSGEITAVLGPSGCGKSTLLRAVAGVEPLTAGGVSWDGADLARVPTHRRGFALMFQDGQLFDHLTVARNVGYGLRGRGASPARRERVAELLDLVGLAGYAARLPRTLSGGERQRVALARCLAARPRLVLLDEPLSALDAALRERLATDLRRILHESGTTALLVTHDQQEAFAVADRLAVMRRGRIVQEGSTRQVWSAPVDEEVARFLGFTRVFAGAAATTLSGGTARRLAVRPSALRAGAEGDLTGTVVAATATPDGTRLVVQVDGVGEADAVGPAGWTPADGDPVRLRVETAATAPLAEG
ncbi:ABC transporter ATP-binding protein [Nocardioides sambongensis]|uniref:ABC transporter ATP-binding protein n=1 Tax=Nocardioides sambongensis TaxID=2589074 RepID=UPI001128E395|nr:ABC transporter ATP-binding protein [Nocardioides sambongensis]